MFGSYKPWMLENGLVATIQREQAGRPYKIPNGWAFVTNAERENAAHSLSALIRWRKGEADANRSI